jgi:hypothetical protein
MWSGFPGEKREEIKHNIISNKYATQADNIYLFVFNEIGRYKTRKPTWATTKIQVFEPAAYKYASACTLITKTAG